MKIKLTSLDSEKSGDALFRSGSITLSASKRSILLNGMNLKEGDLFELTLKKVNSKPTKKRK